MYLTLLRHVAAVAVAVAAVVATAAAAAAVAVACCCGALRCIYYTFNDSDNG